MTSTLLTFDPAAELHACLDRVSGCCVDGLTAEAQRSLLQALTRAESRLEALRFKVLAAADRSGTAKITGAATTGQWAAGASNTDPATAQRDVGLALGLEKRTATGEALSEGLISAAHATVIIQADKQLPTTVSDQERAFIEQSLIKKAGHLSPAALRKAARRALAAIEPDETVVDAHENDLITAREERARAKTRLSLHDNNDGTMSGHFTVPIAQGHLLKKIIETITAPRRGRLGASTAQVGESDAKTDWDRARGEALVELIEHLPTDHLHPRTAATLVVTVELESLREALKVAGLDTNEVISAGQVRRLACTAHIVPMVLGGKSVPLDHGRTKRCFTEAQHTALGLLHQTCAADGCQRPFAWCELHHLIPWSHDGPTDLDNAVPLCHFHHQRIHDRRYAWARGPDGSIRFRIRTSSPRT